MFSYIDLQQGFLIVQTYLPTHMPIKTQNITFCWIEAYVTSS